MPGVFDDGDDVRPLLCHVDQVSARAMRELHRIHQTPPAGGGGVCVSEKESETHFSLV